MMLRWSCLLTVCLAVGALAANSHETGAGSAAGTKGTNCPCGMSNKKGRIVGGTKARPNEYPWIVRLVRGYNLDGICGASIINPRVVITAAHCTHNLAVGTALYVIAGTSDLNKPGQIVPVSKWEEHEKYYGPVNDAGRTVNDICLLHLARPLQFNPNVGPICLPTGKQNIENQWVKIVGWGNLGGNMGPSTQLMEGDVKVMPFRRCQQMYPLLAVPQTQICTHDPNMLQTTCFGDSGGPVTYLDPETNRYTLFGLVSFGGVGCYPGQPTVLTEVPAFLPWIQSKIKSLGCHKVSFQKKRNFRRIVLGR